MNTTNIIKTTLVMDISGQWWVIYNFIGGDGEMKEIIRKCID